jgi:alkylation response protein AidB-like acyl-CoA dehydrogenase
MSMEYGLTDELRQIQALTRRFVQEELLPHEGAVERSDLVSPELRTRLRKRAVELGLYGFNMPVEAGGPGLPYIAQVLLREQLGHVSVALADMVARPPRALLSCKGEQRERFLLPSVRGEKTWAFALTEPEAGSDAGALKTTATAAPGGFRLRGTKHFISHGNTADFVIVIARVADDAHPGGAITAFLVERGTPGFNVGRVHPKMGWRGYPLAELVFDDAFVPEANLLGAVGQGMRIAMGNINEARIGVAAHCVGMAQRALDLAAEHAGVRVQFKQPIARFQGVQWMLADMALAVEQSRALLYAAARAMDAQVNARASVSMAKLSATEMLAGVADRALQIFGGAGYVAESPVEMIYRDARAFRIGEGTSEIQRNQIARALLDGELQS